MLEIEPSIAVIGITLLAITGSIEIPVLKRRLGIYHHRLLFSFTLAMGFIVVILSFSGTQTNLYVLTSSLLAGGTFIAMTQIFTLKRVYKADPMYFGIFGTLLSIIAIFGMKISVIMISNQWDITFAELSLISSFMLGFLSWLVIIYPAIQYLDPTPRGRVPPFRKQLLIVGRSIYRRLIP